MWQDPVTLTLKRKQNIKNRFPWTRPWIKTLKYNFYSEKGTKIVFIECKFCADTILCSLSLLSHLITIIITWERFYSFPLFNWWGLWNQEIVVCPKLLSQSFWGAIKNNHWLPEKQKNIFSQLRRLKVCNQGAKMVDFRWELSSWLVNGGLFFASSLGRAWRWEEQENAHSDLYS